MPGITPSALLASSDGGGSVLSDQTLRFAVIPSNGRACLKDCLMAIQPQVDYTIIVYTVPYKEGEIRPRAGTGAALRDLRVPNISRWWNQGLNMAVTVHELSGGTGPTWDVAILNDDVIVPEGWFNAVATKMREMRAAAACSGGPYNMPIFHTRPGPVALDTRLQGFAFMVAGEKGLRANEDLRWYFSDDFMDWESRRMGGMVMIPGFHVTHLYPNAQMTPELQVFCAEDAAKFQAMWGMMPW